MFVIITKKGPAWEFKNSLWLILSFAIFFNYITFFIIGSKAKNKKWIYFGIMYAILTWGSVLFIRVRFMIPVFLLAQVACIIHAFMCRKEYLIRREILIDSGEDELERQRIHKEMTRREPGIPSKPASPLKNEPDKLSRLYSAYSRIESKEIKVDILDIYFIGREIYEYVAKNPGSAEKIKSFDNYYLPETIRLLEMYHDLEKIRTGSKNSDDAKKKIEGLVDSMNEVFKKQLDNLLYDRAIDVKTDIDVLTQVLKGDGYLNENNWR